MYLLPWTVFLHPLHQMGCWNYDRMCQDIHQDKWKPGTPLKLVFKIREHILWLALWSIELHFIGKKHQFELILSIFNFSCHDQAKLANLNKSLMLGKKSQIPKSWWQGGKWQGMVFWTQQPWSLFPMCSTWHNSSRDISKSLHKLAAQRAHFWDHAVR